MAYIHNRISSGIGEGKKKEKWSWQPYGKDIASGRKRLSIIGSALPLPWG